MADSPEKVSIQHLSVAPKPREIYYPRTTDEMLLAGIAVLQDSHIVRWGH